MTARSNLPTPHNCQDTFIAQRPQMVCAGKHRGRPDPVANGKADVE